MSFQDIESGLARSSNVPMRDTAQSSEEAAFSSLQSSLSLQVFKINANVQGILKLVDQLATGRDSAALRKSLYVFSVCLSVFWWVDGVENAVSDMTWRNLRGRWLNGARTI